MHMQRLHNNTGELDPRLGVACPPEGVYLWNIFNSLGRTGSQGASHISQQELLAWQTNYRTRLTAWEIDTLKAIDDVAAKAVTRNQQN